MLNDGTKAHHFQTRCKTDTHHSLDRLQSVYMAFGEESLSYVVMAVAGRKATKPSILCECRKGNAGSPRQKFQTFKMAVHIWYGPRVSSEASYPQNG
jgi:hypothetical protein